MGVTIVTLTDAWDRLRAVRGLRFSAKSDDRTSGWNGTGTGTVKVAVTGDSTIIFTEHGTWVGDSGKQLDFHNTYRWSFDWDASSVRLEHLRHDPNRPVFLLDLVPTSDSRFESVSPHRCGADIYAATVEFGDGTVDLHWNVRGPKKDASVCCRYEADTICLTDFSARCAQSK
jgi:hypothetical protein